MATFSSSVANKTGIAGSFDYTPRSFPGGDGTLGGTYTLTDGTALTMTDTSTNANQVNFTVTSGGKTYNFQGAYAPGNTQINGTCTFDSAAAEVDTWTATEQ